MNLPAETREQVLTRLYIAEGKSFTEIGRTIGISRGAVAGKLFRMGLTGTRSPTISQANYSATIAQRTPAAKRAPPRPRAEPRPPRVAPPIPPASDIARIFDTLHLTNHACKWPIGEPHEPGFGYCGLTHSDDGPYCPGHAARACIPMTAKIKGLMRWAQRIA